MPSENQAPRLFGDGGYELALTADPRLVQLVRPFEIPVFRQAARVGARAEMVVQRLMRASTHRYRFHIAADAAVDEYRLALHLATIVTEEPMLGAASVLIFGFSLHWLKPGRNHWVASVYSSARDFREEKLRNQLLRRATAIISREI